ncbi:MAG: fasciclin domain-containing protein [Myxococcota bacterium]
MQRHLLLVPALALAAALQPHPARAGHGRTAARADIVTTAARASEFSTLVRALGAAELDGALRGDGPLTVFAPTDKAFAKLPRGTLESLLKPENRDQLRRVLLYHVVSGRLDADDVTRRAGAETLAGPRVAFSSNKRGVNIDDASVVQANIRTRNGIIHAIDEVLLPPDLDLVSTAAKAGTFDTLLAAASAAGLDDELRGEGPYTVFAPTDKAFDRLGRRTIKTLLEPENRDALRRVLANHIVHGRVYADEAARAGSARTAAHEKLRFSIRDGRLTVDGASVLRSDIDARNGVVHVVDRVLVPES